MRFNLNPLWVSKNFLFFLLNFSTVDNFVTSPPCPVIFTLNPQPTELRPSPNPTPSIHFYTLEVSGIKGGNFYRKLLY